MDCSRPASLSITNSWSLLKTHVHRVSDVIQPACHVQIKNEKKLKQGFNTFSSRDVKAGELDEYGLGEPTADFLCALSSWHRQEALNILVPSYPQAVCYLTNAFVISYWWFCPALKNRWSSWSVFNLRGEAKVPVTSVPRHLCNVPPTPSLSALIS